MPTLRIPLAGSLINRATGPVINGASFTQDQYFDNCVPEVTTNPVTGQSAVFITKRPGLSASSAVQASATGSYGAILWTGASPGAAAPLVMSFKKSTGTSMMFFKDDGSQVGSDVASTNACAYMDETLISTTANLTASLLDSSTSAVEAWFFPDGGAWTQITDGDFPSNICPEHAHIDGYMVVMTTGGRIYNSDLNSLSAWTSTSFLSSSSYADNGIGVARYKNTIVAFGAYSIEFYYNAGNPTGSVLSRIKNADIRIGCFFRNKLAGRVFLPVGDTIYWLGVIPETGRCGLYRLQGYGAEKVSNQNIDKFLQGDQFIVGTFHMLGMSHLMLGNLADDQRLCYCIDRNFWWRFVPGNSIEPSLIIGGTGAAPEKGVLLTTDSAKFYSLSSSTSPVWQDDGSAYTMIVQTAANDLGTRRRKFFEGIAIIGDKQSSTSEVGISWSDDDQATFTTARNIDMAVYPSQKLPRLGSSRRRSWKFTHAANTAFRAEAAEIDYTVGQT